MLEGHRLFTHATAIKKDKLLFYISFNLGNFQYFEFT